MRSSRATGPLLSVYDWIVALLPLLTAESVHSRRCETSLSLWNGSIHIDDPRVAVDVWIALAVLGAIMRTVGGHPTKPIMLSTFFRPKALVALLLTFRNIALLLSLIHILRCRRRG